MELKRSGGSIKLSLKSAIALLILASASLVEGQTLQTLCSFNGTNGAGPQAALTLGNDGNFYGTTAGGGITNSTDVTGMGTVFRMRTNGTLTTLVSFNSTNGANPIGGLALGNDGNFYGTTEGGGNLTLNNGFGYGTLFKVTTNGTLTTLVSFNGTNGAYPQAPLTLGNDGNFYGTTAFGGNLTLNYNSGYGTVFKVTTDGTLTTLVSFNTTNGAYPQAVTLGNDGNFYGTTSGGGNLILNNGSGYGTVFKVTTNGTLTTLVAFNGFNGANPNALTLGGDGNFYGTTGSEDSGVFKVTTNGTLTTLFFSTTPMESIRRLP